MQQAAEPGTFDRTGLRGMPVMGPLATFECPKFISDAAALADGFSRPSLQPVGLCAAEAADQPKVRELVALLRHPEPRSLLDAFVDDLVARGQSVEHIYLRLLQPAARRLGELWLDDVCSFVDVTLATSLLQSCLRRLAPLFQRHARPGQASRSVLLATIGDDQHTFGMNMAAEFFRRSGWSVVTPHGSDADAIADLFPRIGNTVVGFSASRPDQCAELAATIRRLRQRCRGRLAGVLVGGPLFVTEPDRARLVGADAVGLDARQALAEAEALAAAGAHP